MANWRGPLAAVESTLQVRLDRCMLHELPSVYAATRRLL